MLKKRRQRINKLKLAELGEFGLIERIRKRLSGRLKPAGLDIGIGDDCAVFKCPVGKKLLVTTDALIEDVHFSRKYFKPFDIGFKAAACNLSDIAAMGGNSLYLLVTLGLPRKLPVADIDGIYEGIESVAADFKTVIAGGDVVQSPGALVVSITAIGITAAAAPVLRSGARPGDIIFTTGGFGDSAAGLYLLKNKIRGWQDLKQNHLNPYPRLKEGAGIARTGKATAMIDSSDGFVRSVQLLCRESDVGCNIYFEKIPVSRSLISCSESKGLNPVDWILFGGEEYELIFTVSAAAAKQFEKIYSSVGVVTAEKQINYLAADGKPLDLPGIGYDHFK